MKEFAPHVNKVQEDTKKGGRVNLTKKLIAKWPSNVKGAQSRCKKLEMSTFGDFGTSSSSDLSFHIVCTRALNSFT